MRNRLGTIVTAGLLASGASVADARAEEAAAAAKPRVVEEIIVTAQKTEQNLRDVPISMSVMEREFIAEQSITDYRDLAMYAPNVHVDTGNGLFPDVNVRGFGSALSNKAFEQSVGLAIDGVPYGRAPYFQGALFDVERVEVLRGPQGTLFGKNTTAGLFNVVTAPPSDEFRGFVSGEVGELARRRFEFAIGGPLVGKLVNFRLAGVVDERDGLLENTTARTLAGANHRMNDRDRKALRFKLGVPDLLGASLVLSYERTNFGFSGTGWEPYIIPEQTEPFYRAWDPHVDFKPDNWIGSVDTPEFDDNRMQTFGANASYDIGNWRLDALAGHSVLKVRSLFDDDFGPQPMITSPNRDDSIQSTTELRARSPHLPGFLGLAQVFGLSLGMTDVTAGFFYQRRKLADSNLGITLNLPVIAQFAAANNSPPGTPLAPLEDFIGPAVPIAGIGIFNTATGTAATSNLFDQTTTSYAGFAQMDWRPLERWTLQYGMRFTQESKEGNWDRRYKDASSQAAFTALGGSAFTAHQSQSEFAFTPKVAAKFDWNDDVSLYATWARGFKAGGFNEQTFSELNLNYKPEQATAWEVGAKTRLLGGAATVNVALFWETITDYQVLTVEPNSVVTSVKNAGKARSRGVEVDSTWLPTSWLTLVGSLSYDDSRFLQYPLGQCSFDRPDTDGNGDGACDHTGRPLFRTPKWRGTVVANARYPLTSIVGLSRLRGGFLEGIDVLGGGTVEYQDGQYLERTFDERVWQPQFFRFGANFGFGDQQQGWSARVVVENLTNQATDALIRDVPLGGGNFFKIPEPQRLIFGSLRWSF